MCHYDDGRERWRGGGGALSKKRMYLVGSSSPVSSIGRAWFSVLAYNGRTNSLVVQKRLPRDRADTPNAVFFIYDRKTARPGLRHYISPL